MSASPGGISSSAWSMQRSCVTVSSASGMSPHWVRDLRRAQVGGGRPGHPSVWACSCAQSPGLCIGPYDETPDDSHMILSVDLQHLLFRIQGNSSSNGPSDAQGESLYRVAPTGRGNAADSSSRCLMQRRRLSGL